VNTDVHTLSGAYALDALSPEDAARFKNHLDACSACRQEVRELRAAAARLGAAAAAAPPEHLKARVMAAAQREAQLAPKARDGGAERQRRTPAWFPRLLLAAAAAVLVVAGGIGYIQMQDSSTTEGDPAAAVVRVFDAPDAHRATVQTSNGGTVSVATSRSLDQMALNTDGLPELEAGKVYQLWAITDGVADSAGLLENPARGAAMELPASGIQVAITIEPAGGSEQPTNEPILTVTPSQV
jgi:anti-sigma-K factor RskA